MKNFLKVSGLFVGGVSLTVGHVCFAASDVSVDLGMYQVPVLNQENYGVSTIYSTTAALDALLGKGDFIDQDCTTSLVKFLHSYDFSDINIINSLKEYGVVRKDPANKCPQNLVSLEQYTSLVDHTVDVSNVHLLEFKANLDNVRQSLDRKNRVLMEFGLMANPDPVSVQGFDFVKNKKTYVGGLWACKQPGNAKNYCRPSNAGHAVVVIGYDDTQKLLKVRNSWGNEVGENGDFYMSYEFFEKMAISTASLELRTMFKL